MVLFTFLNDADWRLWASFFACVKDLVAKSGSHTVDKLTPFLEQVGILPLLFYSHCTLLSSGAYTL